MNDIMQDPMFFYGVAFVVFIALAFAYGRRPALGWIDGEIAKIRAELDQAYQLRAEAEAALSDCKARQIKAEAEAISIVAQAKQQVVEMRIQAEKELETSLARHKQLAAERIRIAEQEAIADVRTTAIELAMSMARKSLSEGLSDGDAARLVDQAIADLPALAPSKAKAA